MLWLLCLCISPVVDAYRGHVDCKQEIPKVCDFIVVGAGAGGATVASRLSEDPYVTVCLFEAGIKDKDGPFESAIATPRLWLSLFSAPLYWNTSTVPQKELNGRVLSNSMGKVLGGSTTVNGLLYYRGFKADYDYWAENGATGWDFHSIFPFFLKSENNTIPELANSPFHSTCGPFSVSSSPTTFDTPLWKLWAKTMKELSMPIGECNSPTPPFGLCPAQWSIRNGKRESTATAFLNSATGRKNLFIITQALVGRILISRKHKRAYGVRFLRNGRIRTVRAKREVIISGGTFESPKLLQLSGIGPRSVLNRLKVKPHVYLPVGESIQDHVLYAIDLEVNVPTLTMENLTAPNTLAQYLFQQKGLWSEAGNAHNIYLDLTVQRHNWPEVQLNSWDGRLEEQITADVSQAVVPPQKLDENTRRIGTSLVFFLSHPKSRGTVTARSMDPSDAPLIDPKYLSRKEDMRTLIDGIRRVQQIIKAPSMRKAGGKLTIRLPSFIGQESAEKCSSTTVEDSDAYWVCVLRQQATVGIHAVRGCPIGSGNDKFAVVDPQLRVKGIKALRVADASVMPEISSANTMAPTIMIGEKAADLIKRDYMAKQL